MSQAEHVSVLLEESVAALAIKPDGIYLDGVDDVLVVEGGGVLNVPLRARAHRDNARGIAKIDFKATALDRHEEFVVEDSRFLGPSR